MSSVMAFGNILEEVDKLPLEDQDIFKEILSRRIIERQREQLANEIQNARAEYNAGVCQPISVDDLMKEIVS